MSSWGADSSRQRRQLACPGCFSLNLDLGHVNVLWLLVDAARPQVVNALAKPGRGRGMRPAQRLREVSCFDRFICSGRPRSLVVLCAVAAALSTLWALALAGPASAASTTAAFTTQGCTTWTVPAGVSSVQIQATGAAGSAGNPATAGRIAGGAGGLGDGVSGTLSGLVGGLAAALFVELPLILLGLLAMTAALLLKFEVSPDRNEPAD